MSKKYVPKEGAMIEGIFAMYCALFLIDPNHGKNFGKIKRIINGMRVTTKIKELSTKGKFGVVFDKTYPNDRTFEGVLGTKVVKSEQAKKMLIETHRKYIKPNQTYFLRGTESYPDFTQVRLNMTLKEKEVGSQYGANLRKLVSKYNSGYMDTVVSSEEEKASKNFKSVKDKIDKLVSAQKGYFFRKLTAAKEKFLKNDQSDVVFYHVDADGVGGESSGGEIKQDVSIYITANGKELIDDTINFSLKSDATTFANIGLYDGIKEIYNVFNQFYGTNKTNGDTLLAAMDEEGYGSGSINRDALEGLWALTQRSIPASGTPLSDSDYWWNLFEERIFGTRYDGTIEVIDVGTTGIKEIRPEYIKRLREDGVKLQAKFVSKLPDDIRIMPDGETDETKSIFKIRVRKKRDKKNRNILSVVKFMYELGGKKSIIFESNYDTLIEKYK